MTKLIDLTGMTFGRLIVINRDADTTNTRVRWVCRCECGKTVSIGASCLRRKNFTKSCGCFMREEMVKNKTIHGMSKRSGNTAEYRLWRNIKNRCFNNKLPQYKDYGGRGITMHPEWIDSFESFYTYIGHRPGKNYSIDRIDNDGNYEPGNIRWATKVEQANNTSRSRFITFNGLTKTLAEWSRHTGISQNAISSRIDKRGWSIEDALTMQSHG